MPNPFQNQGPRKQRQPRQPQQNLNHESRTQERELGIRDDRVIVKTDAETVLTPEQTVNRYNNLATRMIQIQRSIDAYTDKIAEVLDEHNFEMAVLHSLHQDHDESFDDLDVSTENLENSISPQDIDRFNKLQEMKDQLDKMSEDTSDGLEDLDELYPYAQKMAQKHGMELEYTPDEVRDELEAAEEVNNSEDEKDEEE